MIARTLSSSAVSPLARSSTPLAPFARNSSPLFPSQNSSPLSPLLAGEEGGT